jgi:hypothetical protein
MNHTGCAILIEKKPTIGKPYMADCGGYNMYTYVLQYVNVRGYPFPGSQP